MSAMGAMAARVNAELAARGIVPRTEASDTCANAADCEDGGYQEGPAGGQAETSIAVDSTGQHVVAGFNDTRGFALNPLSVSGFMYSDDGGRTFVDGGQLPTPGTDTIGTTRFPQVFGDPEVKYLGACNFVYASIGVLKFSATRSVQTMVVHRSTDCGHTWQGPFEVTAATNPHGQVSASGTPRDAADKEFMDVDPETGRVILSWSNFTPFSAGGVEISTTFSDDILSGNPPTWSARSIVGATAADGQSSIPRFAGNGSTNVYVAWRRFPFPGVFGGFGNTIALARSTDNGLTWTTSDVTDEFFTMDQVLGNDRVNTSPSLAVDNSGGRFAGNVYLVYANNNNQDGADIAFQRSTDAGVTFSAPVLLDARPGHDRAQWFPWVTVDKNTGRVYVFYYDQGAAANGDLTQVSYTYSDNGGATWKGQQRLSNKVFQAGWGNDTGQPNLGDYSQGVAQGGELFAVFASTTPVGFKDGLPGSTSMTTPDVEFQRIAPLGRGFKPATLDLAGVSVTGGSLAPGSLARLQIGLRNYVTNPANAEEVEGITARLSTTTPGVVVVQPRAEYRNIDPGQTATNKKEFVLAFLPSFVAGTVVDLNLDVRSDERGSVTLSNRLMTNAANETVLFSEDFESSSSFPTCTNAAGTVGAWCAFHQGGANVVPWTTTTSFCGTSSKAAFHQNENDGPAGGSPVRFERLFSPVISVPANAQYVTVEFDACYNTEDEPNFNIQAYDGFLLRMADVNDPGLASSASITRSVLPEAFEDELFTGSIQHFPKHFPRSGNSNYFQDMSAWAGNSGGMKHVRMRLPGMAGSNVQLRFEYTQDGSATCLDVPGNTGPCGVLVDNIVIKAVSNP